LVWGCGEQEWGQQKTQGYQCAQLHGRESLLIGEILSPRRTAMWLVLAIILILFWIGGFLLFHLAAFLLHIVLIIAAVALILHLLSGGRRVV
jgi:hypothetical protein